MAQLLLRLFLFAAWPFIALVLLASIAIMLVAVWVLIPISRINERGGKYVMSFPWAN